tara:strand:- start:98 stop:247 length:150 start_codon:yes stop_codon:yes gene_type:complete
MVRGVVNDVENNRWQRRVRVARVVAPRGRKSPKVIKKRKNMFNYIIIKF